MTANSHTKVEVNKGIAKVTLFRPERMNAFTPTMRDELVQIFENASKDDKVRVLVVTGEGKAFCAGADLSGGDSAFDHSGEGKRDAVGLRDHRDGGGQVALAAFNCRKPVIAAINGAAVGVGITMTLAMDIRVVAENAKIGFVFARRGIVPEACSSWFLPRIVGISKATEWIFTGRVFRASEEASSGLFNRVLPEEDVLTKAMTIAEEIAQNTSSVSIALSKALLWHGLGEQEPQSVHLLDSQCVHWTGQRADAYEGVQSFLEKRPPKFSLSAWSDMPDFYPWWKEPKV